LKSQKELVFVSGCFDVLHFGHINFLRQAKAEGEKLLVVLHDDDSIKKKKGEGRPINPLGFRMELIKELESVDYVTSWHGWEDIADFVIELKPGILAVTEGNYERKSYQDVADKIGAKIIPLKFLKEVSSSEIIKKIEL
jgi:D-beta-D-heptose 7-phosphate kinase/D-beta-D-heptose 1-phosphate adenosyltransferase